MLCELQGRSRKDAASALGVPEGTLSSRLAKAKKLLAQMESLPTEGLSEMVVEELEKARTYFRNHHQQMSYAEREQANLPIGSGVTEAACKELIKARFSRSGMR